MQILNSIYHEIETNRDPGGCGFTIIVDPIILVNGDISEPELLMQIAY